MEICQEDVAWMARLRGKTHADFYSSFLIEERKEKICWGTGGKTPRSEATKQQQRNFVRQIPFGVSGEVR